MLAKAAIRRILSASSGIRHVALVFLLMQFTTGCGDGESSQPRETVLITVAGPDHVYLVGVDATLTFESFRRELASLLSTDRDYEFVIQPKDRPEDRISGHSAQVVIEILKSQGVAEHQIHVAK